MLITNIPRLGLHCRQKYDVWTGPQIPTAPRLQNVHVHWVVLTLRQSCSSRATLLNLQGSTQHNYVVVKNCLWRSPRSLNRSPAFLLVKKEDILHFVQFVWLCIRTVRTFSIHWTRNCQAAKVERGLNEAKRLLTKVLIGEGSVPEGQRCVAPNKFLLSRLFFFGSLFN